MLVKILYFSHREDNVGLGDAVQDLAADCCKIQWMKDMSNYAKQKANSSTWFSLSPLGASGKKSHFSPSLGPGFSA